MAYGNMKARLRMRLTYYYANIGSPMVIGTSKITELHLGYYKKYGDGGVDIMPFADIYKCQIRTLGRYLGVPANIIEKQPLHASGPYRTQRRASASPTTASPS